MKLHLRADSVNCFHVRFTVFMNGANCGQLCMTVDEGFFFHDIVLQSSHRTKQDNIYSSGQWFLKEKEEEGEKDGRNNL